VPKIALTSADAALGVELFRRQLKAAPALVAQQRQLAAEREQCAELHVGMGDAREEAERRSA
jgi:hypothetical protein